MKYSSATSGLELYDLHADIAEAHDVAQEHPDIVAVLSTAAERERTELGDDLNHVKGTQVREPGRAN